ncbi:hypothetical protein E2C01_050651 [Portunus trituberculatus]|uniref:Uncharacterized protein n=1 Tax=Portunus trituberculatus TaxID=210409 RepID=A0A5B7GGK0_PORTR|nr:hypothetical protein [Portunus trituberculatus]
MACPRYLPAVLLLVAVLGNEGMSQPLVLHNTPSPSLLNITTYPLEIIRPPCRLFHCYIPNGRGGCMLDRFCQLGVVAPPNEDEATKGK